MRTFLIIVLFFILQFNSEAQNWERFDHKIDSLEKLVNSASDTLLAKAINGYGETLVWKAWYATNEGEFAVAYETYGTAFELFENPKTEHFFKSFEESTGYEKLYWSILANINFNYGLLMGATENREERLRYNLKTYEIAKKQNDILHLVYSNGGMAMLYLQESNPDSALAAVERALSYDPELFAYASYPMLLYFKGSANLILGEYQIAKSSFISGIEYAFLDKSDIHLAINCLGLSEVYSKLDEPDSSYHYGIRALNLLKEIKEIQMLKIDLASGYENMYNHFRKFGQQDSAYKYLQLTSNQRYIYSQKTIKNLAAFQQVLLEKQMQLKDMEKQQMEAQAKNRTYFFALVFTVFMVIGALLFYSNRQKQKTNFLLSKQKQEIQAALSSLKSTQNQLIHSEKMASLGELTAGIAHEIQNPLNFVNNFSELSTELIDEMNEELDKGELDEAKSIASDIKQNLEKINHHGKRADNIVKGMLAHSRKSSGEKIPTDINALADEYLRLSYHGIRAKDKSFNASFTTEFDADLPRVSVIPQDIGRVLLNLINNAFQACTITKDPTVTVSTARVSGGIKISVSDNGPGIPEEIKDKIFQPFFTTKPAGQGTGLGLSLSYDIVKAHGGELTLDSNEEVGTQFTIKIPIA